MHTGNDPLTDSRCPVPDEPIVLPQLLRERLVAEIKQRLPTKSFGYLISEGDPRRPDDYLIFEGNIRNSAEWKGRFESYGQYFLDHEDAGFVATPEESWRVQKQMWARGMVAIGVFHSHLRHPANFSMIDYELHTKGFQDLWHMIVSCRNEDNIQIRAFTAEHGGVRELPVVVAPEDPTAVHHSTAETPSDDLISQARQILSFHAKGQPAQRDSRAIFTAVTDLLRSGDTGGHP